MYSVFYRWENVVPEYDEGSLIPKEKRLHLQTDSELCNLYQQIAMTLTESVCDILEYVGNDGDVLPMDLNNDFHLIPSLAIENRSTIQKIHKLFLKAEQRIKTLCPEIEFVISASKSIEYVLKNIDRLCDKKVA